MSARRTASDNFSDAVRAELAEFASNTRERNITTAEVVQLITRLSGLLGHVGVHGAVDKAIERGATALVNKLQDLVKGKVP